MALLRLLAKRVRAHVYLGCMNWEEIKLVLLKYVPDLKYIQVIKSGATKMKNDDEYFILCDEYKWHEDKIVERARQDLKKEFTKKFPRPIDPNVVKLCVNNICG